MPLFDYACPCGHVEEVLAKVSDPKTLKCPACGKKKFKRQIGRGLGKLYRPDRDKAIDTMTAKIHTYDGPGNKVATKEWKPKRPWE